MSVTVSKSGLGSTEGEAGRHPQLLRRFTPHRVGRILTHLNVSNPIWRDWRGVENNRTLGLTDRPPQSLSFFMLAFAFLIGALATLLDKPTNRRATGSYPPATHLVLHQDGQGLWRYVLMSGSERYEMAALLSEGQSPDDAIEARTAVTEIVAKMLHGTGWCFEKLRWVDASEGTEQVAIVEGLHPSPRKAA